MQIWEDLANLMQATYEGMPIKLVLIDSGFRPGKKEMVPEHRVYAFCRRFPHLVRATKGSSVVMRKPVVATKIDVKINGREFKKGLDLLRLDSDYFKSLVHQKVRWPEGATGAWYLPLDISDDYCMQIVSEARLENAGGQGQLGATVEGKPLPGLRSHAGRRRHAPQSARPSRRVVHATAPGGPPPGGAGSTGHSSTTVRTRAGQRSTAA